MARSVAALLSSPGKEFARPGAIVNAGHYLPPHVLHIPAEILEESDPVLSNGRIFRDQVHILGHSDAVGELQTCVRGGGLECIELSLAHPRNLLRADLEDLEPSLSGFFHEGELVHVPVLRPISEVYSDGIHKLDDLILFGGQVTTLSMPPSTK